MTQMDATRTEIARRRFLGVAMAAAAAPAIAAGGLFAAELAKSLTDDWKRPDGPLGNGWKSAHDDHPKWWDQIAIHQGKPVNVKPDQGKIAQPDNSGARCAAYQDFGPKYADNFSIGTWWNGKHEAVGCTTACVNLEHPDWGLAFCYEPLIAGGVFVLWAMGRRPNEIRVLKAGGSVGARHVNGTKMFLEMQVRGAEVTCLADEKEILKNEIPKPLLGSSIHGVIIDVNPSPGRPANKEVISGPFVLKGLAG